jgi:uncharacterized protein with HEPN domain
LFSRPRDLPVNMISGNDSMEKDLKILLDIVHAARLIIRFTENMTFEEFFDDERTQSAALYQILVIGEAVKRLSSEFRAQHPHIPWKLIAGMRDRLIHGYDVIDWVEVWNTVRRDIPDLLREIEALLP